MAQHFLTSPAARTLSVTQVARLSEEEAIQIFRQIRWPDTHGQPVCPHCTCATCYEFKSRPIFRCKACRKQFSVTSGTLFAYHKLPIRDYLVAVALYVNGVKGKAALELSRQLGIAYKTAFVLAHKLREAPQAERRGRTLGGDGKTVEIDSGYSGGHNRPANHKKDRIDRRLAENQTGKRQCFIVIRERDGRSITKPFPSEEASLDFIRSRIEPGTVVHADEAPAWNALHARFDMKRINHSEVYSWDGACTNQAESMIARIRRAEWGIHHHISGQYLGRYIDEMAWREDHRRESNGAQFRRILSLAAALSPSVDFCGYWQRHRPAAAA
ncbi:MAG TPA: IS1595 family transposase [Azospirillaceae bacterium]|nr:IS1595 family transposase [Azospirillaceae bacterium]